MDVETRADETAQGVRVEGIEIWATNEDVGAQSRTRHHIKMATPGKSRALSQLIMLLWRGKKKLS